jgi:3-oxoadipate enol-lactonase / 4-carboxymuconolactone decarboxylase
LPFISVDNVRLFYRLEGKAGRPVLILSHSIGCDHGMWESQIGDLLPHFHVLRYDIRGHGASDAPPGPYSVERLGRDLLGLVDALSIPKFAFCGLSLGGAIGQWLGIHAKDRLTALVLASTSPQFGPAANWETRIKAVSSGGMASILELAMHRFFSAETLARRDSYAESVRSVILGTNPEGYIGCCAALRDMDNREKLREISTPTLILIGDRDVSTPWAGHGELLARDIKNSQAVHLPAAHLSNIERPRSFSAAMLKFLDPPMTGDTMEAGLAVRRAVLGDEHVDRAIASATEFNRDFQDLLTRYAWGAIWTRPGLSRRTRRLLALVMTASMGRWEEFRMHVKAGLAHELEPCDLKELLMQVAVYAGLPAANTGFHVAQELLESGERKPQGRQD